MAAIKLLCYLIGKDLSKLSKEEILLLEADFFSRICGEVKEIFRKKYRNYFRLMKFTKKEENMVLETNLVSFILDDILSTGEYDLQGIAYYTDTHEDILQEVIDRRNSNPSAKLLLRSIDLHRLTQHDLYFSIIKKIIAQYGSDKT